MAKKTVVVGMSGGVDSSVSAALLQREGWRVIGVFMKNWSENPEASSPDACPWIQDQEDARRVADHLGIPLYTLNFEKEYRERVFDVMVSEYAKGRTPNPDVLCNQEIKFDVFFEKALDLGALFVATGHYARRKKIGKTWGLFRGHDASKDQAYFLYRLTAKKLSQILFPLGEMKKSQVRAFARKINLPVAEKKDSQGICFVGNVSMADFLHRYLPQNCGPIEMPDGKVIGQHEGLAFYTIGQRKGLPEFSKLSKKPGVGTMPWYVVNKIHERNVLVVAPAVEEELLYHRQAILENVHWNDGKPPKWRSCDAEIRYHQNPQKATLTFRQNNKVHVTFEQPQRSLTEGQSVVFYEGDRVLGGGIITQIFSKSSH